MFCNSDCGRQKHVICNKIISTKSLVAVKFYGVNCLRVVMTLTTFQLLRKLHNFLPCFPNLMELTVLPQS